MKFKRFSDLLHKPNGKVMTVGMSAVNMRNNTEKNMQPELLKTFEASLPMSK